MGAWRQKVIKGSKAVSSMFGSDISDTVHQMITSMDGTEKQKINQGPDWQNKTFEKVMNEDFSFNNCGLEAVLPWIMTLQAISQGGTH
jgi:hypothetical protein